MVSWLLQEIKGSQQIPNVNLSQIKISMDKKVLCNNEITSVSVVNTEGLCNLPNSFVWTTSHNMEIIGDNTKKNIQVKALTDGVGYIYLNFPNGQKVSQKIWVGKPRVSLREEHSNAGARLWLTSAVSGVSLEEQGIKISDIVWKNTTTQRIQKGDSEFFNHFYRKNENVEVTFSNLCKQEVYSVRITSLCKSILYTFVSSGENTYMMVPVDCLYPLSENRKGQISNKIDEEITIQITDIKGHIFLTTKNKEFSLAHLLAGTYYARVIKNGQVVHTQTLLKR